MTTQFKVPVKYPARVQAESPLTAELTGANLRLGLDETWLATVGVGSLVEMPGAAWDNTIGDDGDYGVLLDRARKKINGVFVAATEISAKEAGEIVLRMSANRARITVEADRSVRLNNYMNPSDGRSLEGAKARMWAEFGGKPSRVEIWNDGLGDFTMTTPINIPDNSQVAGGAYYSDNHEGFRIWSDNRARIVLSGFGSPYILGHPGQSVDALTNQNVGGSIEGLELVGPGVRSGTHGVALANVTHWKIENVKVSGVDAAFKLKAGGKGGCQHNTFIGCNTPFVKATTNYDLFNDVLSVGTRRGFLFEGPTDSGGRVQDTEIIACSINAPLVSGVDTLGAGPDLMAVETITAVGGQVAYAYPFIGGPLSVTLAGTPVTYTIAAGVITIGTVPVGGEALVIASAAYGGVVNATFIGCRFVSHTGSKLVETALSGVDSASVVYIPKNTFLPANAAEGMYIDCTLALADATGDYAYRFIDAFEDAGAAGWKITVASAYGFTPAIAQEAFIGYGDAASRLRFPASQHQHVAYYASNNKTAVKFIGHYSEDMCPASVHVKADRHLIFQGATFNNKKSRYMARTDGTPYVPLSGTSHKPIGAKRGGGNLLGDIWVCGDPGESNLGEFCWGFMVKNETGSTLTHGMSFSFKSSNYMAGVPANYTSAGGDVLHGAVWDPGGETVPDGEWFMCSIAGRQKLLVKGNVTAGQGLYSQSDYTWVGANNASVATDDALNRRAVALISRTGAGNALIMAWRGL